MSAGEPDGGLGDYIRRLDEAIAKVRELGGERTLAVLAAGERFAVADADARAAAARGGERDARIEQAAAAALWELLGAARLAWPQDAGEGERE